MQLHGGASFIKDYKIEQMYRDSRINRIFEGTNEINRLLIPSHLYRRETKGDIPLQKFIGQAVAELQTPSHQWQGLLGRERAAVASIRRLFLFCAGLAFETFGDKLTEEQETLMKLADIAIHLYAAESAVLRAYKAIERNGASKEGLKERLATAVVDDTLIEVEMLARCLAADITNGEKKRFVLRLIIGELSPYQLEGGSTSQRRRDIAERIYEAVQYIC
jgi:alkylation response protein AidB-like acyl-CoA dehydrogenase